MSEFSEFPNLGIENLQPNGNGEQPKARVISLEEKRREAEVDKIVKENKRVRQWAQAMAMKLRLLEKRSRNSNTE